MIRGCPPAKSISAFARGEVSEDEIAVISDHIDECEDCQRAASSVSDADDSFLVSLRAISETDDFTSERAFQQCVARVTGSRKPQVSHPRAQRIRDYELLEQLGQGSMGTVYRARHWRLDRCVAIKMISNEWASTPNAISRFEREAKALGRLDHTNIVRALDAGEEYGELFLVMEFIDGVDITSLVKRIDKLPIHNACEIIRQAALGMDYAYRKGVYHRDVKPSNLMLSRDGSVKLLDLGLAKILEPSSSVSELTEEGMLVGTIDFMAPERLRGQNRDADIRSDIYSLGSTLYFLLTGQSPYEKPATQSTRWNTQSRRSVVPLSTYRHDIPAEVKNVVNRMIATNPDERYLEPRDVASALEVSATGSQLSCLFERLDGSGDPMSNSPRILPAEQNQAVNPSYRILPMRRPTHKKKKRSRELLKIMAGGVAGVTLGVSLLWYGAGLDPFGIIMKDKRIASAEETETQATSGNESESISKPEKDQVEVNESNAVDGNDASTDQQHVPPTLAKPSASFPTEINATSRHFAVHYTAEDLKKPKPSEQDVKASLSFVRRLHAEALAAAKLPLQKVALANDFLAKSQQCENASDRYAYLAEAAKLATLSKDINALFAIVDDTSDVFAIDPLRTKQSLLRDVVDSATTSLHREALDRLSELVAEAMSLTRFKDAEDLCDFGVEISEGKNSLRSDAKAFAVRSEEVRKLRDALATLADSPNDPVANLTVGRIFCFELDNWEDGLPMLKLGRDKRLQQLAKWELEPPSSVQSMLELADEWWDLADSKKPESIERRLVRQHASEWYSKVFSEANGLMKDLARKRIKMAQAEGLQGNDRAPSWLKPRDIRKLRSLFSVPVTFIDSDSLEVKLEYDFKDARQVNDWSRSTGFTFVTDRAPEYRVARGVMEFYSLSPILHKAVFSDVTTSVKLDIDDNFVGVVSRASGAGDFYYLSRVPAKSLVALERVLNKEYVDYFCIQPDPFAKAKSGVLKSSVSGEDFVGWANGTVLKASGLTRAEGHVGLIGAGKLHAVKIEGTLSRAWLEKVVR